MVHINIDIEYCGYIERAALETAYAIADDFDYCHNDLEKAEKYCHDVFAKFTGATGAGTISFIASYDD